jgi:hypothetical protein
VQREKYLNNTCLPLIIWLLRATYGPSTFVICEQKTPRSNHLAISDSWSIKASPSPFRTTKKRGARLLRLLLHFIFKFTIGHLTFIHSFIHRYELNPHWHPLNEILFSGVTIQYKTELYDSSMSLSLVGGCLPFDDLVPRDLWLMVTLEKEVDKSSVSPAPVWLLITSILDVNSLKRGGGNFIFDSTPLTSRSYSKWFTMSVSDKYKWQM